MPHRVDAQESTERAADRAIDRAMSTLHATREALARAARHLYERGHNAPFDGNLSARVGDDRLLTTPTGRHKGQLTPADIAELRWPSCDAVRGQASSELSLHRRIYEARPEVRAIAHAHSPHTVALTIAGVDLRQPVVPEAYMMLGAVATVPYVRPTTDEIAELAAPLARDHDVFVLERHGPVALGRTLEEAVVRLETLEHVAQMTILARTLGPVAPLDAASIAALEALRQPPSAEPSGSEPTS